MENTNIDALMFLSKWCDDNKIHIEDDLKKEVAKIMYYYTKESNTKSSNNILSDIDIEQVNRESKIIQNGLEEMKSIIHKTGLAQDVITKLTS